MDRTDEMWIGNTQRLSFMKNVLHWCVWRPEFRQNPVQTSNAGEGLQNRPFAINDHTVQNPPCWRASSLLFPHWDIKTKRPEPVKLDLPLF